VSLAEYLTSNLARQFEWGSFDCVLFAAGWLKEATGRDCLEGIPKWADEKQARRIIASLGGLEAATSERMNRVLPALAKDGDIALYNNTMCIFSGAHIVGPGASGLVFFDRTKAECAWSS
jgi:predicted ATP-grasp superfamily ATP-dependent carboligase